MSRLLALKSAASLYDVAALLGFTPKAVAYLLYAKPVELRYKSFDIVKRSGGKRRISAPSSDLLLLQSRLRALLQDCTDEIEKTQARQDQLAHGFKRDRSIVTNASKHKRRRFVFNIDLKEFFPSINFGRVRGFFIKDNGFALDPAVATVLAQIACHENNLPQGSPCSPIISNLVGHILDVHLCRLASRNGCTYSRYADDITFSTNEKSFPSCIAIPSADDVHVWHIGKKLEDNLFRSGFSANPEKTRMQYRDSRQEVTGLVVNKKVNIRTEYRHTVRAMAHRLFTTGRFDFVQTIPDKSGEIVPTKKEGSLIQLHGMFGHIDRVDRHNLEVRSRGKFGAKRNDELTSKETLYRRFLLFKEFYAAPEPVIVCEGKTDNIYLKYALKSLGHQYPNLAHISDTGEVVRNVRIFRYTESSTGKILNLKGGTGDLKNLILTYTSELKRFRAPGKFQPIVLLIDNDQGAKEICSVVKDKTRKTVSREEEFIRIAENLYLVLTPPKGEGKDSTIEDCFSEIVKASYLEGKTFLSDELPGFDPDKNYGKSVFADKIVQDNWRQIDFSGFAAILQRIDAVVEAHRKECFGIEVAFAPDDQ